ncbi:MULTISPECIES: helix-turn-helix domain-containing protein [Citrobacter]|uniref:Helix-turn-helix transcriptional regulator n=1 Tax=Citrobacter cronae TaxID=1748967 RepID=A0A7X1EIX3_9ENTR|nr:MULTISPECIES: helix-turn-helix transcriptional regulator [Citrobacter]MBC2620300.1 helix-turn-helix transcriptional regulator [Citrobacter cronae]MDM3300622.1 helix-turn-helix transcriptional regulator [Citrobacter sp. Cc227]
MSDESPVFEKIPVRTGELFTLRVDNINNFNGINVVPHYHMMDELMWFRDSAGSYSIGDEKFTIKNNMLVFVPALLIHEMVIPTATTHKRYLMQFEKEWLDGYDLSLTAAHCGAVAYLSGEEAERLELLLSWCGEFTDFSEPLFRSLMQSVLLHAFNSLQGSVLITEHTSHRYLSELIELLQAIDASESFEMTTEEAARRCQWSKSWFSKTFKSAFGISFKKFMLLRKLNIAINLLTNTDLKISDISQSAGFTDSAYFCLKFKEMMNDTPLAFRHKVRSTDAVGSQVTE